MHADSSLQNLVELYLSDPSESVRSQIVLRSIGLVRSIIGKIHLPESSLIQPEDLESVAIMGLIDALDHYDLSKNAEFSTFAYVRVRGGVIDYLRSVDPLTRTDRNLHGSVVSAYSILQQRLGRNPSETELCDHLDLDPSRLHQLHMDVQQRVALSNPIPLDELEGEDAGETETRQALFDKLAATIRTLPPRDRIILTLYYYEELTLREIGLILKLSEARISQLLGSLLVQLKASMIDPPVIT